MTITKYLFFGFALLLLALEPGLCGNKFQTIGGGVAGSTPVKLSYLRPISAGFGVFFLICTVLSASRFGHARANSTNYSLWRQSAAILGVLTLMSFAVALFA